MVALPPDPDKGRGLYSLSSNKLLTRLCARGHTSGPLFSALERIYSVAAESPSSTALFDPSTPKRLNSSPDCLNLSNLSTPERLNLSNLSTPERLNLSNLSTPERLNTEQLLSSGPSNGTIRTVQDFAPERATARAQGQNKNHAAPLFEHLGSLVRTRAPAESWPLGHQEPPPPASVPRFAPSAADGPMKTIHDFTAERATARAQFAEPPAPVVVFRPVESLTACMDSADCPATARKIFRVLFSALLWILCEHAASPSGPMSPCFICRSSCWPLTSSGTGRRCGATCAH